MTQTRVKICGVTSPEDARLCQSLGADYLGLIFAPSPRRITAQVAESIRRAVPDVMLVGVFADAPIDDVVLVNRQCRLNFVQLHGTESPEYSDELRHRLSLPIIQAFRSSQLGQLPPLARYRSVSYFLFDLDKNRNGHALGELQNELWTVASDVRRLGYRIFLGGGLTEGTVREAIRRVNPHGVDVASGVEREPGVKDREAVEHFIRRVRS